MKRTAIILAWMLLPLGLSGQEQQIHRPEQLQPPKLEAPALGEGVLKTLDDGLNLYMLPDEGGLLHALLYVRGGEICEPSGRKGISLVMCESLLKGGTALYPSSKIAALQEKGDFNLSYRSKGEWIEIEVETIKGKEREVLTLFKELLTSGVFPQPVVEEVKGLMIKSIEARKPTPLEKVQSTLFEIFYGEDFSESAALDAKAIRNMQRNDIAAYYKRYFFPANGYIALNSDPKKVLELAATLFPEKERPQPYSCLYPSKKEENGSVIILQKSGDERTCLVVGKQLDLSKDRDLVRDRAVLDVICALLNSEAPSSRLKKELEVKRKLVANLEASISVSREPRMGRLLVFCDPKPNDAGFASFLIGKTISDLAKNPPDENELLDAKKVLIRKLGYISLGPREMLLADMEAVLQGFPPGYQKAYAEEIAGTSREAITEVAGEYFSQPKYDYVIYGSGDKFYKEMSLYGNVMVRGSGD